MVSLFDKNKGRDLETIHKENEIVFNILNSITDGFFLVNNEWVVLYWNKSAEEIMHINQCDIIGKNLWDVFVDTKEMAFYINYHQSKKENKSLEFDINYERKGLWLEMKTNPFEQGLAVYFKDVTVKKKLALEVEYIKRQQEAIINATADSIWSINRDFELLIANNAYVERVLSATGRLIKPGDNVLEGYSNIVAGKRKAFYERGFAGETFTVEDAIPDKDSKELKFIENCFNPIIDSATKKVIGVACYSRDITERKKYQQLIEEQNLLLEERERSLREVSNELKTVLNSSPDLICSVDKNGKFVHLNNPFKSLLGYEPNELKGTNYTNLVHPEDLSQTVNTAENIYGGSVITDFRNRFVQKDGQLKHIIWSARWDSEKELMFSVGRDASSIIQAEISKAETEKKFTALIKKGADMIGILDCEGYYQFVTPNITQILGFSETELIGQNAFDLIHPHDVEIVQNKFEEILVSGDSKKVELRFKDALNNYRWIEIVCTNLLNDPTIKGIVINSRDISDRKLQEEKLLLTNERYQTVVNITNEVIWEWDLVSGDVMKNKNYENLFGHKSRSNCSSVEQWTERIHPDDIERIRKLISEKIKNADSIPWKEEYKYFKGNGNVATVVVQAVLIIDKNHRPIRMVGSMQDVTQRKKIENEREMIIEELTISNNDLKQFSFITSHNLRAPLSNICGILKIIDGSNLSKINKQLFELLESSAMQLQETIQDLTDIIVIRGRNNIAAEQVFFEETFENIRKIYLNTLNDIPYVIEADFKLEKTILHKPYLESIFINLVSNAVKYRSPDRVLKIGICTYENKDGDCIIVVSDNGVGLDIDRLKNRVFGMYQRFHQDIEGKGLGLFIVKSQVTAMGGTIDLQSEINQGSRFTITLPKRAF